MQNLKDVYSYRNQYVQSPEHLIEQIINKTIIPHQIEVQPGPKSKSLCWLNALIVTVEAHKCQKDH